jgi:hypothetical protein
VNNSLSRLPVLSAGSNAGGTLYLVDIARSEQIAEKVALGGTCTLDRIVAHTAGFSDDKAPDNWRDPIVIDFIEQEIGIERMNRKKKISKWRIINGLE